MITVKISDYIQNRLGGLSEIEILQQLRHIAARRVSVARPAKTRQFPIYPSGFRLFGSKPQLFPGSAADLLTSHFEADASFTKQFRGKAVLFSQDA